VNRRLLLVHAHPDDELLTCGVTISHYLERGVDVEVLTCTLGDEGEIIPAELARLATHHDDTLGVHRAGELAEAMRRVGARHTVLGAGPGGAGAARYRDSGMAGSPSARDPRAFVNADLAEAATLVADIVARQRPDAVVTYDAGGGYGHPDHVQTRRVVLAALAGLPASDCPERLFEVVTPMSWAEQDRRWLATHVPTRSGLSVPTLDEPYPISVVPDTVVTHAVLDVDAAAAQAHALAAHATQVRVFEGYYALSNDVVGRLAGREAFVRLDTATGSRLPASGARWRGLFDEA
jgi:N-acetyl-1-D-myo-inositol-2-amino-2-deoxy-alpha-D-glucopyranoside deacetylase